MGYNWDWVWQISESEKNRLYLVSVVLGSWEALNLTEN